jgi:cytochrome c biogenesis protein CcmG, thiol:disulfide interchange protein DsbE
MRSTLFALCLLWQGACEAGALAPEFSLPRLSPATMTPAKLTALSEYRGKVVFLDFWASWCGVCQQSLPAFDRLQKKLDQEFGAGRFVVLAVNLDAEPKDGRTFLQRVPVSYPVLSDIKGVTPQAYGLSSLPSSVLIHVDGRIVAEMTGYRESDLIRLEKAVRVLLAP